MTVRADQFADRLASDIQSDIESKMTRKRLKVAEQRVLEHMDEVKNRESLQGKSPAKGGRWNNVYNRQYANRKKQGRLSPVTLRQRRNRIEDTQVQSSSKRSTLSFRDGKIAQIFRLHHTGQAKGGKIRQVYPKRDKEVPESLDQIAENAVFRILNE